MLKIGVDLSIIYFSGFHCRVAWIFLYPLVPWQPAQQTKQQGGKMDGNFCHSEGSQQPHHGKHRPQSHHYNGISCQHSFGGKAKTRDIQPQFTGSNGNKEQSGQAGNPGRFAYAPKKPPLAA